MEREKNFKAGTESSESNSGKPQIFIDQMFKKRSVFGLEEMRDEVATVILTVRTIMCDKEVTTNVIFTFLTLGF